ncbi:efflux RND transporter permease subunit [Bradyrhizobium sp. AUGA SZCCT0177]|uniref:efflux RND transporter permease subunit n=1 Tax=unclassified Bradyrhizobium TaxID=2631580 RepID=UPI001BA9BE3E|nr:MULTISPECIES: efflux RND transporter permease subunit [unclassified Bradyrhizobium]MBR1235798.1 efflux RND transporter permease subunit [Bradyrhizobium sp. AUGA SZCCT0182]MBR1280934.1 efflux RND transporter permease subunit [Bradyrhizobium sp. AUGA SZCCT0177]
MKRFNLSGWAVSHPTLILFLMIALGVAGFFSYERLGRAEDPFFTVKVVNVSAIWPGATAQEMQTQVADPIEKKLQELPYFEKVQTYSKPAFTAMQVTFKDSTPPAQVPYLFYLLRKKLADVQGQLPAGLLGPNVNDEFSDVDSILYMMTGDGADYAQLKKAAEGMRQRLLKVPGVTKVNLYGAQDERIFVEFSHAKLATIGVTPQALFDSLAKQNNVTPAGTVETSSQRVPLRVTGALDGAKAVAETPVESNGRIFRLGDIATVTHGFVDPPTFKARQEGKPALGIGVVTAKGANILELGKEVENASNDFMKAVPQGINVEQIADQPKVVERAVGEFVHSFVEALAIVLFVSFLALGWRTGIVVAMSVPLVLAIVFIVMNAMSIDLHRITLGALIIALGLLVDDAIIAVEMMVVKMEQGWDRVRAASFAWESTAFPMLTGTLVTAAGFLPIGFANSAVGEYAGGIFWIVAISLVASWFVAVIFTPYIGVKLLPNIKVHHNHDPHAVYETRVYRILRSMVQWCVDHRIKVVVATVGVFALSIVGFGNVQQQFFPLSERPELFLQLRLPEGTAFNVTEKSVKKAEALLKDDKDIATYTSYVGQGSPRFWLGLNPQLPNEAFAEIVIVSKDVDARERIKARLEKAVAGGDLSEARVRIDRFNFGPPVGFPVQFRVIGPDPNKVRDIAYQVRDVMRQNPNALEPQLDWNEQSPYLKLVVDQDRARALGLTPQDVSQALSMLISGAPVTTIRDGIEKVGVIARAVPSERLDLGHVGDLTVTSRNGVAVPLQQIAKIEYAHEEPILWRRNRDMAITVRTDVADGVQAPDVTNQIWPKLQQIRDSLEPAYRIEPGGAFEESAKGNASIAVLFPLMALVMLTLLMIQLQSFSRLILVFLTAPLGIVGASLGLNIAGQPFGFVALLGLIALAGMIMRNAVILVDQIETDVSHGMTRKEAIVEATVRRARPVILTALAAILAMIPLSRSAFWGPMAITIMGGLFVATFLTLLYLPGLYALWFRKSLEESGQTKQPDLAPQHAAKDLSTSPLAFPLADAAE